MYSNFPEQAAIAAQLAAELADYEQALDRLLARRFDPALYGQLADQFDRMHVWAQLLPRLASCWTELMINRVDLAHTLWTLTTTPRISGRLLALHAQHAVLIRELLRKCMRYLTRPPAAPGFSAEVPPPGALRP